ncbi:MAG TPA: carbohydrate ABC transporter permease [Anaerolineae bacterium]|nr:carbohydrate ABC transporter permease [Anaerolineae bacterium]HOR00598.1 carbohydrate ABC transporter permease [Anaerolineae bacterium]HOR00607.1 carbohydrate ABC transporter permease [Anaerolineae bacterium]
MTKAQPRPPASRAGRIVAALQRGPLHLIIIAIALIWMLPTVGLLVSSFRPPHLVSTTGWWTAFKLPFTFTLENYYRVLTTNNMGTSFVNSLFVSIPATVIPIMIAAFAAYAFAWMPFKGRDVLFLVVVGLQVVPLQMTLIPILRLFTDLKLTGTFRAIWLAHSGYGLPLAIYLLRNFFGSLPREMLEASYIDGASPVTTFFRLVLPTSVPALASLAIFQFLWVWNDLLIALIYLGGQRSVAPMTVTVANLVNSYGQDWQLLTAAAFISMLLPMVVFFSLQQYFVRGILAGSVKG